MKADMVHVGLAAPYREGPAASEPCSFLFRLGSAALCVPGGTNIEQGGDVNLGTVTS